MTTSTSLRSLTMDELAELQRQNAACRAAKRAALMSAAVVGQGGLFTPDTRPDTRFMGDLRRLD